MGVRPEPLNDSGDGRDEEDEARALPANAALPTPVAHRGKVLAGGPGDDEQESSVGEFLGDRAEGLLFVEKVENIPGEGGVGDAAEAGGPPLPCASNGVVEGGVGLHEPAVAEGAGSAHVVEGVVKAEPGGSDSIEE